MLVLVFSTTFAWNISHSKNNSGIITTTTTNAHSIPVEYPLFLPDFI